MNKYSTQELQEIRYMLQLVPQEDRKDVLIAIFGNEGGNRTRDVPFKTIPTAYWSTNGSKYKLDEPYCLTARG